MYYGFQLQKKKKIILNWEQCAFLMLFFVANKEIFKLIKEELNMFDLVENWGFINYFLYIGVLLFVAKTIKEKVPLFNKVIIQIISTCKFIIFEPSFFQS